MARWTIPNAIGYVRLALIPVFLVLVLRADDGTAALPAIIFALIAWGDYADGIAARSPASTAASARCSTRSSTVCS